MAAEDKRPTWNEYFMNIAHEVAKRSTCERAQVGAVIVHGSPRGLPHCSEVGCLMDNGHCVRTLHAEQNAIIQAALHGVITEGATIYVTHQPCFICAKTIINAPCFICAKTIINAGISEIVYDKEYRDDRSIDFLNQAEVKITALN